MSLQNDILEPGFYGKLPAYGDFIQKRLPRDFVSPWDAWLQEGISASKERLGEQWLNYYLNCPPLNFILSPSICGEQGCAGVTIPSVDKVGRYFNFTLAMTFPSDFRPVDFMQTQSDEIESALAETALSISPASRHHTERQEDTFRLVFENEGSAPDGMLTALLHHLVSLQTPEYGLWWHNGSSEVSAQFLVSPEMPDSEAFIGFLLDEQTELPSPAKAEGEDIDYLDALLSD